MSKIKQNLVVLIEPPSFGWHIHLNAGFMIFNRFCIDEDAAFELSGVYYLEPLYRKIFAKRVKGME